MVLQSVPVGSSSLPLIVTVCSLTFIYIYISVHFAFWKLVVHSEVYKFNLLSDTSFKYAIYVD